MAERLESRQLVELSRAELDERIAASLGVEERASLDQARLLLGESQPTARFLHDVVLRENDPLDGACGFLFDDSDYKCGYLTVVASLLDAQTQPVPAMVVELCWREFEGSSGAREAAERIYAAIERLAAVGD